VGYALALLSTTEIIQLPVQKALNPSLSEIEVVTRGGIKEDLSSFTLSLRIHYWPVTGRLEIRVDKTLG